MIIGIIHVASISWDYWQNEEKGIWRTTLKGIGYL